MNETLDIAAAIIGIASFIISIILWLKGLWRKIGYIILVRIFNRKPMSFNIFIHLKFENEPRQWIDRKLFDEFNQTLDKKTQTAMQLASMPESARFGLELKSNAVSFNITVRLEQEHYLDPTVIEEETSS